MCNHKIIKELPVVSIIVLNYNGKKWLKDCFESLEGLEYPKDKYEVIMGDNASSDDSVEYVTKNFPWIRILKFDKNYGFCKGNNLCAKEAKGEYLIFLNSDTYVQRNWLIELVKGVLSEDKVIACACKVLVANLKVNKKRVINVSKIQISPGGGGMCEESFKLSSKDKQNNCELTGAVDGVGFLVKKDFFLSTGGFDEYYYFFVETYDLSFRIWAYGYRILYVSSAQMYHFGGGSHGGNKISSSLEFLTTRNTLYFILKNFEVFNVVKGAILHVVRSFVMVSYSLIVEKKIAVTISMIKAYLIIFKDIKEIVLRRKEFQRNKKIKDADLYRYEVIASVERWIRNYLRLSKKKERNFGRSVFKERLFKGKDK